VWYLVADTEAGMRTFRLWRVQSVELTDQPVQRPPGFDLATTWQGVVSKMDERQMEKSVRAFADPSIVGWLRGHFGGRLHVGETMEDGRVLVDIGLWHTESAAMELAGYSFGLEVLDPPEVREQLAGIGNRLVERYGAAS
jgi:predicted DNA-binding transcriptional regulator YafY